MVYSKRTFIKVHFVVLTFWGLYNRIKVMFKRIPVTSLELYGVFLVGYVGTVRHRQC